MRFMVLTYKRISKIRSKRKLPFDLGYISLKRAKEFSRKLVKIFAVILLVNEVLKMNTLSLLKLDPRV